MSEPAETNKKTKTLIIIKNYLLQLGSNLVCKTLPAIAATMLLGAAESQAVNRTLILLQENSGKTELDDLLEEPARSMARSIIDSVAEGGESLKFQSLAQGKYQRFINLSDTACTRANLLYHLINESSAGYTIDLAVLGHGTTNQLCCGGLVCC